MRYFGFGCIKHIFVLINTTMKKILAVLSVFIIFSCTHSNKPQTDFSNKSELNKVDTLGNATKSIKSKSSKVDTLGSVTKSNNDTAIFKDSTSFNISPNLYHYANVRYYHIYPCCCPYYVDAIVKEKQDIEESRTAVGETSSITLDIL